MRSSLRVSRFWYQQFANHASDSYGPRATAKASLPKDVEAKAVLMCLATFTCLKIRLYSLLSNMIWFGESVGRIWTNAAVDGRKLFSDDRIAFASGPGS